tara:strand:+ start:2090 stop:2410 length:321 start_codon:yes stop_codon:yes gene_type:complete
MTIEERLNKLDSRVAYLEKQEARCMHERDLLSHLMPKFLDTWKLYIQKCGRGFWKNEEALRGIQVFLQLNDTEMQKHFRAHKEDGFTKKTPELKTLTLDNNQNNNT